MQRANVIGKDRKDMAKLIDANGIQVVRQTLREIGDGRYRVQAFGEESALAQLAAEGFAVDPVEDQPFQAPETSGDRGPSPEAAPSRSRMGPGSAPDGYLSVDDVDVRLAAIAEQFPGASELITLPHRTWQRRTCRALRIGRGASGKPGILLLGGVHAREWGSADILIAFAERLLNAWSQQKGVAIGRRRFPAPNVQRIVDDATIYIVPQVNPDGRHHSFTSDPMWRKNRRPAPEGREDNDGCVGVDLNRNFDFMWDFKTAFSPHANVACSTLPCDPQVYVGPAAASEPETQNVVWMLDQHPEIAFLIDLHSFGELIMYSWGDDENQVDDKSMTFTNRMWNGRRGVFNDEYREYLPDSDRQLLIKLGQSMQAAIAASRGRHYVVQQSANLYPTAGTSDDYSYSRHLVDSDLSKVLAFTVEWGSEENPTPFHPPYEEMNKIITEMTSGLLAFCGQAIRISQTAQTTRK